MKKLLFSFTFLLSTLYCFSENIQLLDQSEIVAYDSIRKIMNNKEIPFQQRYFMTADIEYLSREHQINICNSLIPEAKVEKDKSMLAKLYSLISVFYSLDFRFDTAKLYLDSAFVYENQIENKNILGVLHYTAGQLYANVADPEKSHWHYYQALTYFEQNGTKAPLLIEIMYSLASYYVVQRDLTGLKNLIFKMETLTAEIGTAYSFILTNSVKAQYYEMLYERDTSHTNYIDSMKICNMEAIHTYLSAEQKITGEDHQVAYNYMYMAKIYLYEKLDSVKYYVDNALALKNPNDKNLQARCHGILGMYFLKKNALDEAEMEFNRQLEILLDNSYPELYEIMCCFGALSDICEKKGNLSKSLEYKKIESEYESKLHDKNLNEIMQRMQTEFDVAKKEQAIQQLTEETQYQNKIKKLYLGLSILIVIILLFIILRYRQKRKEDADRIYIQQMEKEEAQMLAQLREEQANNAELKKYEALMELQIKDLEIEGKEVELESLKLEKEKLDQQLVAYSDMINKFKTIDAKKDDDTLVKPFKNDLKKTIDRMVCIKGASKIYIDKINQINDDFLLQLEEKAGEKLSFLSVKHCIAFAIDMTIEDFATCFDVEPKSGHQIRYRLKQKLKLEKNEELDLFLKSHV